MTLAGWLAISGCVLISGFTVAGPVKAEDAIRFQPQVTIGNIFVNTKCDPRDKACGIPVDPSTLGTYISEIYKYAIGTVGILATIALMIGGLLWATAAGNQNRVSTAQSWINSAFTGLLLALSSYTILYFVNPSLVSFKSINTGTINPYTAEGCPKDYPQNKCGDCYDCMTIPEVNFLNLGLKVKDGVGTKLNAVLADKLIAASNDIKLSAYTIVLTEGWPPTTPNHTSQCHAIGTCADVNTTTAKPAPQELRIIYNKLMDQKLNVLYETNVADGCAPLIAEGVTKCIVNTNITAPHFHVSPQ